MVSAVRGAGGMSIQDRHNFNRAVRAETSSHDIGRHAEQDSQVLQSWTGFDSAETSVVADARRPRNGVIQDMALIQRSP